ncbi:MAG: preprotein translocase subunit SecG [Candidatus Liptonbacteria bacterium]|nr:preprotein translocase subunit SecG [Candidatus Liptonbacteria bacterium]
MIIAISQVIVSVVLIVLILLQERSAGLSGLFGGGEGGAFYQTRRGAEKAIFIGTIVSAAIFVCLAIAQLIF